MAISPEQIRLLVDSFAERDDERFRTVALDIAAAAAKAGDQKLANSVRAMVDRSRRSSLPSVGPKAVPISRPEGELASLLTVSYPGLLTWSYRQSRRPCSNGCSKRTGQRTRYAPMDSSQEEEFFSLALLAVARP